jgi:hypothetical protein
VIGWEPTPPNCAVRGLTALLGREEWRTHPDGERIRELLRPRLDSADDTVRMLASMALPLIIEPENLTDVLCERLAREDNGAVIEALTRILAAHAASDPDGIDACLGHLAAMPMWSVLAGDPEDRSTPPSKRQSEAGDLVIQVLLYLGLVCAAPFASGLLATWQQDPQRYPATVGRLVAWTRPYLNPAVETARTVQTRAFGMFASLADACATISTTAQDEFASGLQISDELRQDLEAAAWIADCIAREIYHASGAFQTQQEKAQPDERLVSPSFCSLALPIIEHVAAVRTAGIAHHLIQTLAFLSRLEPRRAFLIVAKIAIPGSGYEYESLGEGEVLDLVDLYLAERRGIILNDPECLSGLRRILETFVAAGSDRAIRRVQDLAELFK